MRWTHKRKAEICRLVRKADMTVFDVERKYGITKNELMRWIELQNHYGTNGLKTTLIGTYRNPPDGAGE